MIKIAPSILAADFGRLREQLREAESAGADMIHLDIIDGHFAPNISFGKAISKISLESCSLPHDAHLMVSDPENYIDDFLEIGAHYITFHLEIGGTKNDLGKNRWIYTLGNPPDKGRILWLISRIKEGGAKAGLTLNPPTDIEQAFPYLHNVDLLLLMSVNPGFSGQKFIESVYRKIDLAVKFRQDNDLSFEIMVDGGVGLDNAAELDKAGADILVSGSSFFKASDYSDFIRKIKS